MALQLSDWQIGPGIILFCSLLSERAGFVESIFKGEALRTGILSLGKLAHETKTRKITFKAKTWIWCPTIESTPVLNNFLPSMSAPEGCMLQSDLFCD